MNLWGVGAQFSPSQPLTKKLHMARGCLQSLGLGPPQWSTQLRHRLNRSQEVRFFGYDFSG